MPAAPTVRKLDKFESITGELSPVRGGDGAAERDHPARMALAVDLGQGRVQINDAYLGKNRQRREV